MSKLIVEMEMPIGCTWTDENENGHHCPLLDIDCDCVLQEKGRKIGWDEQYANCPIVGVLPEQHGRLIDASTVIGIQQDEEDNDVPVTVDDYLGLQFPVPTIVPATERSKHGTTAD